MAYNDPAKRRAYDRRYYRDKVKPQRKDKKEGNVEDRKMLVSLRLRSSVVGRITSLYHQGIAEQTMSHHTLSEYYTDLIVRGLGTLKTEEAELALQYLEAAAGVDRSTKQRREAQALFSRISTELREILSADLSHANDEAASLYWHAVQAFGRMDGSFWRDWFIRRMQQTFPKLHKTAPPPVSLEPEEELKPPKREARAPKKRQSLSIVK